MKKIQSYLSSFGFIACICVLVACETEEPAIADGLVGNWRLSETAISPGGSSLIVHGYDGPERILRFTMDNQVHANHPWCETQSEADTFTGTYDLSAGTIRIEECESLQSVHFEIRENETLVLGLPTNCIEACEHRYKRIRFE